MSIVLLPFSTAFDATGNIIPGAKLFTWVNGATTTPKAVYSDAALTIAHTNPVIADAAGRFPVMYIGKERYTFELKDANDVVIKTTNDVEWAANERADFAARFLGVSPIGPFVKDDWRALVFDDQRFDTGSDYNAVTGVFTAPRDGRYWFELHATFLMDVSLPTSMLVGLGLNSGDPVKDTVSTAEGSPLVSTRSRAQINANLQLSQGNTITPYVQFQGNDGAVYHTYGAFAGFEKA